LKLAGQREAVAYRREFNTVFAPDLVLAILRLEVRTPADAVSWIDRRLSGAAVKGLSGR